MLRFRRAELLDELAQADWRLRVLCNELVHEASLLDLSAEVTSVQRSQDETAAIYERAGLAVPSASVHGTSPVRGADLVPVELRDPARGVAEVNSICGALARKICLRIAYPRGKSAVIWHDVGAGKHWHLQVPYDGLELLADRLRAQGGRA